MAEKVLFSIKGLHTLKDEEKSLDDVIEVINVADYYYKEGTHYVMYEEIVEGTSAVTKNMVKIKPHKIEINKKGGITTHMCFEEGTTQHTSYYTPEGEISMGMAQKKMDYQEDEDAIDICISYVMLMNFEEVTDSEIEMTITKKGMSH